MSSVLFSTIPYWVINWGEGMTHGVSANRPNCDPVENEFQLMSL